MTKKGIDIAKLAERLAQLNSNQGGQSSGVNFLDIKDGRNVLRVLPAGSDEGMFYEEAWVHYGVGKTKDAPKGTMVVCPTTDNDNAKCPVCELSKELFNLSKKKDDTYSKQAKSVFRKKRVYYNAISRDEDLTVYELQGEGEEAKWVNTVSGEEESPVKVWGTGIGIFKDILGLIVDPEYGDITDADEGLDLIITKTGSGQFNTNYDVKTVRKETPIGFDAWASALNDLTQFTKAKTYDEIAAIMEGGTESTEEDPDLKESVDEGTDILPDKATEPSSEEEDDLQAEIQAAILRRKNGGK